MSDIFHKRDISPLGDTEDVDEHGVAKKCLKKLLFDDDKEEVDSKRIRANTPTNLQVFPDTIESKDVEFKLENTDGESGGEKSLDLENEEDLSLSSKSFQCKTEDNMIETKIESHYVSVADETISSPLTPPSDQNILVPSSPYSAARSASPFDPNSIPYSPTDTAPLSVSSSDPNPCSTGYTDTAPLSNPDPLLDASTDTVFLSTSIFDQNSRSTDFADAVPLSISPYDPNPRSAGSTDTASLSVSPSIPNPPSAGSPDTAPLSACLYDDNNTRSADFTDTALHSASTSAPNLLSSGSTETASLSTNSSDFGFFFASPPEPIPCYISSSYADHCSDNSSNDYTSPPDNPTHFADSPDLTFCYGSPSDDDSLSVSPVFSLCSPSPPDLGSLSSSPLWISDRGPPLDQMNEVPYSNAIASSESLMLTQHQREPNQTIVITPGDCIESPIQSDNNSGTHPYLSPNRSQGLESAENVTYTSGLCMSEHHQSPTVQIIPCTNLNSRRILTSPYHLRQSQPNNWQTQRLILGLIQAQRRFNRTRFRGLHFQEIRSQVIQQESQQFQAQHLHAQRFQAQQFHSHQYHAQQFQAQPYQSQQFQAPQFQSQQLQSQPFQAQQFQDQQYQAQQHQVQQQNANQPQAQQQQAQDHHDLQQQVQHLTGSPLQAHPYYDQQWRAQQSQALPYQAQQQSPAQFEAQKLQGFVLQPEGSQPQNLYQCERASLEKHPFRIILPGVIQMPVEQNSRNSIHHQRPGINYREESSPAPFDPVPVNYPLNQQYDDIIAGMGMAYSNENHGLPVFEDELLYNEYEYYNYPEDQVEGNDNC